MNSLLIKNTFNNSQLFISASRSLSHLFFKHKSVHKIVYLSTTKTFKSGKMLNDIVYQKYQDSLNKLNELQAHSSISSSHSAVELKKHRLTYTNNMCLKLGLTSSIINKLNIIHLTGTKGKGSTCAFVESILKKSGYKTGLFSSPHLIEVRERIKLNGKPLSYEKFVKYFDHCYSILVDGWNKDSDKYEKPSYFQFLTCMTFYVFSEEMVDVAIVEVGIGGEFDFTNIIMEPVACGITSLGLDHCSILGNTVEEIAWQKAGIFKSSCTAFTVGHHSSSVVDVMSKRAEEKNIPLVLVPVQEEFKFKGKPVKLGLHGKVQYSNSALALQLANYWIEKMNYFGSSQFDKASWVHSNTDRIDTKSGLPLLNTVQLNENFKSGLESCSWPGRNQIIKSNNVTYYLDGAHTTESIEQFISWFLSQKGSDNTAKNVLLFNFTGERDAANFKKLLEMKFDSVAFSKLNLYPETWKGTQDNVRKMPMQKLDNEEKYKKLIETFLQLQVDRIQQANKADQNNNVEDGINYKIFDNVQESLDWLTSEETRKGERLNVLVTGSLYLVGLALKVLEFKMD